MKFRLIGVLIVLCEAALGTASSYAQALPNMSRLRLPYTSRKTRLNPQGALKTQIDALDAAIAESIARGETAEVRRLYTKGVVLLDGKAWSEELDFATSLVLRSDRVLVDPDSRWVLRLEQMFMPSIELRPTLSAHIALHRGWAARGPGAPIPALGPAGPLVKDFGRLDGLSRDLRATPFVFDVDLKGASAGPYQLAVTVSDGTRTLGTATLDLSIVPRLEQTLAMLRAAAGQAAPPLRSEILYPIDRIQNINEGRLELLTFDAQVDLDAAVAIANAAKKGRDPFVDRTGDFKRHYLLEPAGEIVPYRLYVPTTYTRGKAYPLIVTLHGVGGTEDSMLDQRDGDITLGTVAERSGYIVAAPLGFRVDGSYGWGLSAPPEDLATRRIQELSERDVFEVLQRVKQDYRIDESRIYLLGHSMGANGVWKLVSKYPSSWAAAAAIAGRPITTLGGPARAGEALSRIRDVPMMIVHGTADMIAPIEEDRAFSPMMAKAGGTVKYVEVEGGSHGSVVAPSFPAIIEFFDVHRKQPKASPH